MLIYIHNNKSYCIGVKFSVGSNPLHKNPMIIFLYSNNSGEPPHVGREQSFVYVLFYFDIIKSGNNSYYLTKNI